MLVQKISIFNNKGINFKGISQNQAKSEDKDSKDNTGLIGGMEALNLVGVSNAAAIMPKEVRQVLEDCKKMDIEANSLAQSVKTEAREIMQRAQDLADEAVELFSQGNQTLSDGRVIRIVSEDDSTKTMEEYDAEGNLSRRSTFLYGQLVEIEEGLKENADGSMELDKKFCYEDNELCRYGEGYKKGKDNSWMWAKCIDFNFGEISRYVKNIQQSEDKTCKIEQEICFEDYGDLGSYGKDIEGTSSDSLNKYKAHIVYFANEIISYAENENQTGDSLYTADLKITFRNGKPQAFKENFKEYNGVNTQCSSSYNFNGSN